MIGLGVAIFEAIRAALPKDSGKAWVDVVRNMDGRVLMQAGVDPRGTPEEWLAEIQAEHAEYVAERKKRAERRKRIREELGI